MNKLKAEIAEINCSGDISIITLLCEGDKFSSLIINNYEEYVKEGNSVYMVFKETEVSVGKNLSGKISIRNRFLSRIISLVKGKVLTEVKLNYKGHEIISIITTSSCENLNLNIGDEVEGLLKTNELLLMKFES